jgi:hypothetical protein
MKGQRNREETLRYGGRRGCFLQQARTTPLRLTKSECSLLHVLEGALAVSEYSDKVDTVSQHKSIRIEIQLGDAFAIISGLVVTSECKLGQALVEGKRVTDNAQLFEEIFEVGRRYAIAEPSKLRHTHTMSHVALAGLYRQVQDHTSQQDA